MEIIIAVFGVLALITFFVVYNAFSWGFVCYKFWGWFILPIFTTLPVITFWQAVGLMFFISLFRNHSQTEIKEEYKDKTNQFMVVLLAPWVLLLLGYFFK